MRRFLVKNEERNCEVAGSDEEFGLNRRRIGKFRCIHTNYLTGVRMVVYI